MIIKVSENFVETEGSIYLDEDIKLCKNEYIADIKENILLAIEACGRAGLDFAEILKEVEA